MADEHDGDVSRRYRELGAEEPRPELDQAILGAAREALERPRAPLVAPVGRQRWYYSLAAAAVAIFAVAITIHFEREQPDAESAVPAALPPVSAPTEERKEQSAVAKRKVAPARTAPPTFAPEPGLQAPAEQPSMAAPVPPASPPSAADATTSNAAAPRARADAASRDQAAPAEKQAAPQREAAPAAGAANRTLARAAAEPAERWLERIAELRRQGKDDDAERELAEFRRRYPDYRIPQAMAKKLGKQQPPVAPAR